MAVVSFRAAWRWIIVWIVLDVLTMAFQADLPSWFPTGQPGKDLDIVLFLCGLWVFERRKEPRP